MTEKPYYTVPIVDGVYSVRGPTSVQREFLSERVADIMRDTLNSAHAAGVASASAKYAALREAADKLTTRRLNLTKDADVLAANDLIVSLRQALAALETEKP